MYVCVCARTRALSHVQLFVTPRTTRLLCPQDFPGENTGMGCHFLLQGFFWIQGSNPRLLWLRIGRWIFIGLYGSKWPWQFLIPLSILHTSFGELAGWTELCSSFPGEGFTPVCHQGCLSPHSSQACSSSLHLMKTVVIDQRAPSLRSQEWLLGNCSFKLLVNLTDESNLIFDTLKPGMKQYHHVDTIL